jgi:hypothetical protein
MPPPALIGLRLCPAMRPARPLVSVAAPFPSPSARAATSAVRPGGARGLLGAGHVRLLLGGAGLWLGACGERRSEYGGV